MLARVTTAMRLAVPGRVHLGDLPALLARRYPDRVLLEDLDPAPGPLGRSTWNAWALERDVAALAGALRAAGLVRGPVIASVDNRVDLLVLILATCRAGAIAVPMNPRLKPEEMRAVVEATGAGAAIAGSTSHEAVADALDGHPVIQTEELRAVDASPVDAAGADPAATAVYLTTSGTTGRPKAAALTSQGLLAPFTPLTALPVGRERRGPRSGRDLALSALPLTHAAGLATALGALSAGVHWLHQPRFDAPALLEVFEERRPNVFVGVPTMYADLEEAGAARADLSSVQLWFSGADRMPEDRARRFQRYGATVVLAGRPVGRAAFVDIYGMVELSGPAAVRLFLGPARTPHQVLPGRQVRAVDEHGEPVGLGRVGQLCFRGTGVLRGYRGERGQGPDAAGWFATGDFGRVWPGGLFTFAGRQRDRLKVGGFSVFPAEVEAELVGYPSVQEVALVGVPDDRLGERPVAVVVPAGPFDPDGFLAWAGEHVAGYRRPREVVITDALPRGPNGKIDRASLTEQAIDRLGT